MGRSILQRTVVGPLAAASGIALAAACTSLAGLDGPAGGGSDAGSDASTDMGTGDTVGADSVATDAPVSDAGVDAPSTCDASSDPHNCGTCGHDCQGGICNAGVCQDVILAAGQFGLASLAVDQTHVYWAGSNGVAACAIGGCMGMPTSFSSQGSLLATDGANLYWLSVGGSSTVLDECPSGDTCTMPAVLASFTQQPSFVIAATSGHVYWGAGASVLSCSATGCGGTPLVVASTPGPTSIQQIAAGGGNVYWTSQASGLQPTTLWTCPTSGCGSPVMVAMTSNVVSIGALTLDTARLYWAQGSQIMTCPLAGCTGAPAAFVPAVGASSVVSDGVNVYWNDQTGTNISMCAAGAFCPSPTVFFGGQSQPRLLASDATSLYWTGSDGSVRKRAK